MLNKRSQLFPDSELSAVAETVGGWVGGGGGNLTGSVGGAAIAKLTGKPISIRVVSDFCKEGYLRFNELLMLFCSVFHRCPSLFG